MKRVSVQFSFRQGWFCEFLEEDRKTRLPRTVVLPDERKLFELVKRGGFTLNISGRQEIEGRDQEETRRCLAGAQNNTLTHLPSCVSRGVRHRFRSCFSTQHDMGELPG
jgi:hypothetical protein